MFAVYAESFSSDDPLSGLVVGERPDPVAPDGWTTVTVKAASLNHHDVWSLRGVGLRRHSGGFRQALEPGGFAIGCGSRLLKRPINLPEGLRSGLADLLEGTLDLCLAFDAEADRDLGGAHAGSDACR